MIVEHGPVGMAIGVAVGMFADIHDVSLAPARMALCADSYHGCRPMYNSFVTLRMADFCGSGKPACVCLFSQSWQSSHCNISCGRTTLKPC